MRTTWTIAAAAACLIITGCGGRDDEGANASAAAVTQTAVMPSPSPSATAYPLPSENMQGLANPDAPPPVAAHIARQERCAHWREEQEGGAQRPEVSEGLTRECRGIDAQLADLRRRFDRDGGATALLRPYAPVER